MDEETELIACALEGDEVAYRRLYDLHHQAVWRLANRVIQRPPLAEDCVQETFIKAFRKLDRYSGESSFAGWVYRIAYRSAVDILRKEMRERRTRRAISPAEPVPPRTADPLLRRRLIAALDGLTEIYREVFLLYHFDECTHPEIARRLSIPVGTSKRRLSVARERLKRTLTEPPKNDRPQ
ncbi:MAG: RNA polymerase sigma factor [Thermoanaerobaculia bacterium]